ncbi:MAG: hypothetical protein PHY47_09620 [Lachnospiraceae bacterium]|nr:hypothetical protein [Lachnospiraceae bacterium]
MKHIKVGDIVRLKGFSINKRENDKNDIREWPPTAVCKVVEINQNFHVGVILLNSNSKEVRYYLEENMVKGKLIADGNIFVPITPQK